MRRMHSPKHIDRPGNRCAVVSLFAVHASGGTTFAESTHRQRVAITRQGHALAEEIFALAEEISCIGIGCLDIGLLRPDTSSVTGEDINRPGTSCAVIGLIAVRADGSAIFTASTNRQRVAIMSQSDALAQPIERIGIG